MDIFMLIMTIVLSVGLLILSIFLLSYYSHSDDKGFGASLLCKFAIVLGMILSWAQVLCLPLDVSNARGNNGGGFRMDLIWEIIYAATAIYLVFINPALSYYYESDEDDSFCQRLKYMFCYLFASVVITSLILFISYAFLSKAEIPIITASCGLKFVESSSSSSINIASCIVDKNSTLEIDVSFPIYLIGIMSFISWFLFIVFGGIGLTALPMDLIHTFTTRPKEMSKDSYDALKSSVISRANQMKVLAESLKQMESENPNLQKATIFNSKKRKYNNDFKRLKANCLVLENDHYILKLQDFFNRKSADLGFVYFYLCLIFGIICSLLSLAWIIHILIYIIIKFNGEPLYPFINNLLVWLQESYASFIAIIIFVVFCIYLLLATIKGSIKFGLRFACWTVHPMKKDATPMNSFLFNINLILITSVSVTQFCAGAFKEYASMTDIDLIFGTQIKYLKFFVYFYRYHIFEYAIFGLSFLAFIYLICRPSDRKSLEQYIGDKSGPSEALIESMQASGLNKY